MITLTLSKVLDDLRAAEQALHKFEQLYWLSTETFYELYQQGMLDDGEHGEDFAEWFGQYQLKLKRERVFQEFSRQRVEKLQQQTKGYTIRLIPQEPVLELV
jgi:hypothetical protein